MSTFFPFETKIETYDISLEKGPTAVARNARYTFLPTFIAFLFVLSLPTPTTTMARESPVRASELRAKTKGDLEKQAKELRIELAQARVSKVTGGSASKLSKIKEIRSSIARVLTVLTAQKRDALKELYRTKKRAPLDLRSKKTRAIRRRLTPDQINKKTLRASKQAKAFPKRKYAVKA